MGSKVQEGSKPLATKVQLPALTDELVRKVNFNSQFDWSRASLHIVQTEYLIKRTSAFEIGKLVGVSDHAVFRALRLMGIAIRPIGRLSHLTEEQRVQVVELLKRRTLQQIANLFSVDKFVIYRISQKVKRNAQFQVH